MIQTYTMATIKTMLEKAYDQGRAEELSQSCPAFNDAWKPVSKEECIEKLMEDHKDWW